MEWNSGEMPEEVALLAIWTGPGGYVQRLGERRGDMFVEHNSMYTTTSPPSLWSVVGIDKSLLDHAGKNQGDDDKPKADPFAKHEIMDRAAIICENWDSYIEDHPWVGRREELNSLAAKIGELMGEFYQKAGNSE